MNYLELRGSKATKSAKQDIPTLLFNQIMVLQSNFPESWTPVTCPTPPFYCHLSSKSQECQRKKKTIIYVLTVLTRLPTAASSLSELKALCKVV